MIDTPETLVSIPHKTWGVLDDHTHESVTELEVCEQWCEAQIAYEIESEIRAERLTEQFYEGSGPFTRDAGFEV